MKTIFYSWQSDLPADINRKFIEKSLESAISRINLEFEIDSSPRNEEKIILDSDIRDTPGSPPIAETIFRKINDSSRFVADLTFIAESKPNPETGQIKYVANPNVLIEYGYAYKSMGHERIIVVMNTEYGEPTSETVPFNIRHLDFGLQYKLKPTKDPEYKSKIQMSLTNDLYKKIDLINKHDVISEGTLGVDLVKKDSKYYILQDFKKILIVLSIKITNSVSESVSVSVRKLEAKLAGDWIQANKYSFQDGIIKTIKGSVSRHDEFLDIYDVARIDSYGSKIINVAFEMNIKSFKDEFQKEEPIQIKGIVKSLDGREASFSDEIDTY